MQWRATCGWLRGGHAQSSKGHPTPRSPVPAACPLLHLPTSRLSPCYVGFHDRTSGMIKLLARVGGFWCNARCPTLSSLARSSLSLMAITDLAPPGARSASASCTGARVRKAESGLEEKG